MGGVVVSASQIRDEMALYLAGMLPLDEFEDWFVQNTWNIHKTGSKAAEILTFAVEEALSEYSSAHISEDSLRNELCGLLNADNRNVDVFFDKPPVFVPKPMLEARRSSPVQIAYLPV